MLRLSRIHYPVTVLGPGRRIGIWTQGCAIACRGCISRDTWAPNDNLLVAVDEVLARCQDWPASEVTGVTITGGEPSEQPAALARLTAAIRDSKAWSTWDVLCYTGVERDEFARRCPDAYRHIDALITGAYRADEPTDLVWRGSANQRLLPLTPRGRQRYGPWVEARSDRPAIQVEVDEVAVRMIGIPRRGDLARLERSLRTKGIRLEEASWRP